MPSVNRLLFETSGLLTSRPPGSCSQDTTPHMLPLHSATRMLATPSATRQSPVGSAASAEATPVAQRPVAKNIPEYTAVRVIFLGQCNMVRTCAWIDEGQNAALSVFS